MAATAPYNFIPFVPPLTAVELNGEGFAVPPHDIYVPGLHSGSIDYTVTTLSPLHIGPQSESLKTPDGKYFWIPGSAVRGLLRSTLEYVLGGDLDDPVLQAHHDQAIYYRAPLSANPAYKNAYWTARQTGVNRQKVGLLRLKEDGEYTLRPGKLFKVNRRLLDIRRSPRRAYALQFEQRWFTARNGNQVVKAKSQEFDGANTGWLLVTGVVDKPTSQKNAYIIAEEEDAAELIVESTVLDSYKAGRTDHTDLMMPDVQKYLANNPGKVVPVFFDGDNSRVKRIGTAGGFRIRAAKTVSDTISPDVRTRNELLAADALFGRVVRPRQDAETPELVPGVASRISVGHAMCGADSARLLSEQVVRLDSPKAAATHLRLMGVGEPAKLQTYDSRLASYRGRTVYLHRWDADGDDEICWQAAIDDHRAGAPANARADESEEFAVQPVGTGAVFRGRIDFHNLTESELGGLLFSLRLWNDDGVSADNDQDAAVYAHKLGGLRPLGLGSVKIDAVVQILDPEQRYRAESGGVARLSEPKIKEYRNVFAAVLAASLRSAAAEDLKLVACWTGRPSRAATRAMSVKEHMKPRALLPTIQELFGN